MNQHVPDDTPWRLQHEASDRLTRDFHRFVERRFGDRLPEAWQDFNQKDFPKSIDTYPGEEQLFFPYFFFEWDPDRGRLRRGQKPKPGMVARAFLEERGQRLPDLERMLLEQSTSEPNSFYEVVRCEPGHGMRLREVLLGGETEVEEHSGSGFLEEGDLVYARICRLPDVTTLTCMAPVAIPPRRKVDIVALRGWLRLRAQKQNRELEQHDLFQYAERIRLTYLNIREALKAPPQFNNTDGEPIEYHTLTYRIGSAQVAFDALAKLAWGRSKEELLEDAEVDQDGTLRSITFDWIKRGNKMHAHWDNTIVGHIKISNRSMVIDVNSAGRALKIRAEIEKRLGILAVHVDTRVQTADEMIMEAKKKRANGVAPKDQQDPKLMEMNRALMQEELEAWVHRRIPILSGRTPMEAMAHPDGREIVESLLVDWERNDQAAPLRPDFDAVRRMLNLPRTAK